MEGNQGKVLQVLGPVVDVQFESGKLPKIYDALTVENGGETQVLEVLKHLGDGAVRCITLATSEGLTRGMAVTATGGPIRVPVGEGTLGAGCSTCWATPSTTRARPIARRSGPSTGTRRLCLRAPRWRSWRRALSHRPAGPLRQGRQDWPVRRRRRGQDRAHSGAYPQHRHRARRLFHLYRRGRAHPRGQRLVAGDDRVRRLLRRPPWSLAR